MSEKINKNEESRIQTEDLKNERYDEFNPGNPMVKAQKQMSSQRTVGVYSPQGD